MGLLDAREDRVHDRFVRKGGPTQIDRLTLSQPILIGAGMTVVVGVLYLMIGRLVFSTETDGAVIVESLLYGVLFTGVYMVLYRRALRQAIERWDSHPDRKRS